MTRKLRTRDDINNWLESRGLLDDEESEAGIMLADGYEDAFVGVAFNHGMDLVAVYNIDRCIQVLVERDGMDADEADEFFNYNTLGAYAGPRTPMFLHLMPDELPASQAMPDDAPSASAEAES